MVVPYSPWVWSGTWSPACNSAGLLFQNIVAQLDNRTYLVIDILAEQMHGGVGLENRHAG
jgi:hypothetical protein